MHMIQAVLVYLSVGRLVGMKRARLLCGIVYFRQLTNQAKKQFDVTGKPLFKPFPL